MATIYENDSGERYATQQGHNGCLYFIWPLKVVNGKQAHAWQWMFKEDDIEEPPINLMKIIRAKVIAGNI